MIETVPRIGDEVYVHGYIDEIRKDIIIIRNVGGYFGTSRDEVFYYEEDEYGSMNSADRKTEPSDSKKPNNCETCKHWHPYYWEVACTGCSEDYDHYEPQTEPQTCANGCRWLNQYGECTEPSGECHIEYRTEVDEPQTERSIGCSRCEGRYDCPDRDMPHAVHCNNYGKVTDEPQTDCAWGKEDGPRTVPLYPMKEGGE